jgi:hypothetical protein
LDCWVEAEGAAPDRSRTETPSQANQQRAVDAPVGRQAPSAGMDRPSSVDLFLASWVLGRVTPEGAVEFATQALEDGCDDASIAIIAGSKSTTRGEIEDGLPRWLRAVGKQLPSHDEALKTLVDDRAWRIANGEVDPVRGAWSLWSFSARGRKPRVLRPSAAVRWSRQRVRQPRSPRRQPSRRDSCGGAPVPRSRQAAAAGHQLVGRCRFEAKGSSGAGAGKVSFIDDMSTVHFDAWV